MLSAIQLVEMGSQGKPAYLVKAGRVMTISLIQLTLWFRNGRYCLVTSDGEVELADCYAEPVEAYQRLKLEIESTINRLTAEGQSK